VEGKNNWIDDILQECEIVETPRSWIWWSLIAAISASCGNNYYLKALNGAVTYRPNLYIILLGPPGLGKAFGVNLAAGLVRRADVTRVIEGRSSVQAIISDISKATTREKKGPILDSRAFVVSGELATVFVKDPEALKILTDLYDPRKEWVNRLKTGEVKEILKDNYVTLLAASNEVLLRETIPEINAEGGLGSRTLFVEEKARYKDLDLLTDDAQETDTLEKIYVKYSKKLEDIGAGSGKITYDNESKDLFNAWRRSWRESQVGKDDKSGFGQRFPDHVLKVAMLLSLADYESNLIIRPEHVTEALEKCLPLTYTAKKTSEGTGPDPLAPVLKLVLDFLVNAPDNTLKRKQLLVKGYGKYNTTSLDMAIDSLLEMDWISKEKLNAGRASDWIIHLKGEPLEQYKKFLEQRKTKFKVM
jgi:hypothetical protein